MKKFPLVFCLLSLMIVSVIALLGGGCANIVPPEGGYRDTLAPRLVKAAPGDSFRHFTADRITLTFDEFIDLNNVRENMIVSPVPRIDPVVESKLRTVTIKLKDSLEPNTTYTINLANSIKDVNEGNVVKNFNYVFTTGSYFDSLSLSGKVFLAENGKVDTTLIVMLHKNGKDSAVVNEKPRYIARVDKNGNFAFNNLPAGTFYVYALKDEGGTRRYLSSKQVFAFADKPVNTQTDKSPLVLYAYVENQKEAQFALPSINVRRGGNNAEKRLRLQTNVEGAPLDLLNDFVLNTDQPVKTLDTSKMHFSTDSSFIPVTGSHIMLDSTRKKIILKNNWKENTRYNLIVEKDFAEDSVGRKLLKADTFSFRTRKLSEYGELKLRLTKLDLAQNPVLQFVQNDIVVRTQVLTSNDIDLPVFLPGDYDLRVLFDRNKNGKWDPGEFFNKHLQPEMVKPIDRKITVKANWENDFEVAL
jgi:hypothetical protein